MNAELTEVTCERLRNTVLGKRADNLLGDLPALKKKQRGNAANVKLSRAY